MPEINYEAIEANIEEVTEGDGHKVDVKFKCGDSGKAVAQASAQMKADRSAGGRVQASVKRSFWYGVKRFFARLVGRAAGGGVAGSAARSAAHAGTSDMGRDTNYTGKSKNDAVVEAFKSVQSKFRYDEEKKKYVAANPDAE